MYCSLGMKENFGTRPLGTASQWMFMVHSEWLVLFPMAPGWLLLFPGGLWMVAVISWWTLDGCTWQSLHLHHLRCECQQSCGPTENTVSINTVSHLCVTHSHCM